MTYGGFRLPPHQYREEINTRIYFRYYLYIYTCNENTTAHERTI